MIAVGRRVRGGCARARRRRRPRRCARAPRTRRRAFRARTRSRSAWKARSPGPAASIGDDQLHWAQFFASSGTRRTSSRSTSSRATPSSIRRSPRPSSQSFASNSSIVGVIGPAGSQEVTAVAPILKKAGLAFVSGSATNVVADERQAARVLLPRRPERRRAGPDGLPTYMMKHLGVKKGTTVMIVDDQESYSTGLADIVQQRRSRRPASRSTRESISQKDHRLLVARRQGRRARRRSCSCRSSSRRRPSSSPSSSSRRASRRSCSAATARSTRRSST